MVTTAFLVFDVACTLAVHRRVFRSRCRLGKGIQNMSLARFRRLLLYLASLRHLRSAYSRFMSSPLPFPTTPVKASSWPDTRVTMGGGWVAKWGAWKWSRLTRPLTPVNASSWPDTRVDTRGGSGARRGALR